MAAQVRTAEKWEGENSSDGKAEPPWGGYKFKYNTAQKMQTWPPERDFQQKLAGFQLHHKTSLGMPTITLLTHVQERWTEMGTSTEKSNKDE